MRFVTISARRLELSGYRVTPADGVPGLWNVAGLAYNVTTNQLHDLADKHGAIEIMSRGVINWTPGA